MPCWTAGVGREKDSNISCVITTTCKNSVLNNMLQFYFNGDSTLKVSVDVVLKETGNGHYENLVDFLQRNLFASK